MILFLWIWKASWIKLFSFKVYATADCFVSNIFDWPINDEDKRYTISISSKLVVSSVPKFINRKYMLTTINFQGKFKKIIQNFYFGKSINITGPKTHGTFMQNITINKASFIKCYCLKQEISFLSMIGYLWLIFWCKNEQTTSVN